ncbi:plasma membrane ATPase [Chaetomidium leptoderma]|uniref:Plasma membrane ATPase n=1 Tax=Chaetomidium leptoderma TaxID=669021 RepID=A0AAN6ZZM5_9PEZI|nr:plasma membrane ATPase [Chaetomidium leptoderma]
MADHSGAAAPALATNIESGKFDEKEAHHVPAKQRVEEEEEEDEDMDALIDDLESNDGHDQFEEEEDVAPGGERVVPEDMLQTDTRVGLTSEEVIQRRRKYGLNQMKEEKENLILKFLGFFVGPIQFVMEVLAAGLEDWVDFGVICGLLLLNAAVGFIQEYQAGSIVDELKKTLALKAVVLRDGTLKEVEAPEVVPGDILQVEEGTIIPADGRIVTDDAYLQVDQSAITGESLAVDKHKGDQCYASSAVKRGEAFVVITATGDSTFVGRAAALVNAASAGTGHFTEVLNGIGTILLVLVILTNLVVWVSSFYRSNPIVQILEFTLAITIVGVPVGLPAVVTTTMAVGAAYLAKKKAIVQKLSAIESLAGVEILCSDKTGTLTKNKLSLAEPYTVAGVEPEDLMLTACLAASRKKKGMDAIDKAFLKSLKFYPRAKGVLSKYKVIEFFPFDPVSKKVTAVVESPQGERIICVKGAPLFVLKTVEEDHPIPEEVDQAYKNKVAEFATRGFRSLGVARKRGEGSWEILGIMPCSDPPRHDTARTVNEAKGLGLSIKMLTGDAVGIARETSRQLGLGTNIYNAERLGLGGGGDMPGSEVYDFVEAADGFAEVFPQHKYNVVEILQQRGYLVAMTGDGVNDAPSLKKADTGIAVEGASDAARSAADIVFLAPGLGAIIDALKTSRQIFHRMYAYVVYRIALSIHLEIFLGLWIAILNRSLNIELVVFIAIFADVATLAIAYDNAPYSRTPVKWNLPKLWGMSVLLGIVLAVGTWITVTTMYAHGKNGGIVQNFGNMDEVVFLQISLTENWLIFITRANGPFWSSLPSWQLAGAVLIVDIVATLFTVFGWFEGQEQTSIVAVVRIWIFSFGIFCVMGGIYYMLQDSVGFDNLMHGKSPKGSQKQRSLEDFVVSLQRVSTQHEKSQKKMNREIPGFYYDSTKRKYFRIEDSRTAPAQAAWASKNVKRRAAEEREEERKRERLGREAGRVKRARVMDVPLLGGLLARETGGGVVGGGRAGEMLLVRAWAGGLREKGSVDLWSSSLRDDRHAISSMWVGGSDEPGELGVAFAVLDGSSTLGSYVPRDAEDRINFRCAAERYPGLSFQPRSYARPLPVVTAVKFHEPSGRVLLAGEHRTGGIGISHFTPQRQNVNDSSTPWALRGDEDGLQYTESTLNTGTGTTIRALQSAPSGSRLTAIAGTDKGIIQLQNDKLTRLTPPPPSRKRLKQLQKQGIHSFSPPWQGDILSVDFLTPDIILAGTRCSHVCVLDLRAPPSEWNTFRHTSSAAHVRSTTGLQYEVLVAGPLEFPSYRNAAHIHTGLDVLTQQQQQQPPGGYGGSAGRGIVATAHDDGTVGLYSLADGTPIVADGIQKAGSSRGAAVVQSMMWQTLPGDRHPSLFVGEGMRIRKYSFWA